MGIDVLDPEIVVVAPVTPVPVMGPALCGSQRPHAPHEYGEAQEWCNGLRPPGHNESAEDSRREKHHARRYEKHIIRQFLRLRLTKVKMELEKNPDDEHNKNRVKVIEWLMQGA